MWELPIKKPGNVAVSVERRFPQALNLFFSLIQNLTVTSTINLA
jgi:hypothetical protein